MQTDSTVAACLDEDMVDKKECAICSRNWSSQVEVNQVRLKYPKLNQNKQVS